MLSLRGAAAAVVLMTCGHAYAQAPRANVDRLLPHQQQSVMVDVYSMPGLPRLQTEHVIKGQAVSLASIFAPGGLDIEVSFWDGYIPPNPGHDPILLLRSAQALQNREEGPTWHVAVVVADTNDDGTLSALLDFEGRRTVVVYAEPHKALGEDAATAMFAAAAHELTHAFNLHHSDWEGSSLTADSTLEGYAPLASLRWHLSEASLQHLRHAPDEFVRPGGVAFGVILPEHAARHQPLPVEEYTVVSAAPAVALAPTLTPGRVLGPMIVVRSDVTKGREKTTTTTRDIVVLILAVQAIGAELADILVTVSGADGTAQEVNHTRSPHPEQQDLDVKVPLRVGANTISVVARDRDRREARKDVSIVRTDIPGKVLAVVLGVQDYPNVPPLKHSLRDADAFRDRLFCLDPGLAAEERLFYKENPDLRTLRSSLGTWLRRKAGEKDLVIVYFAGHGAAEPDEESSEPDKLSKYLLPLEADLGDLPATALPMSEILEMLRRVKARTVLVILDTCFSGAAGGRAVTTQSRSVLDPKFFERNAGRGRVILSASGPNEAARESDARGHGVFTYFLLQALDGKADKDKDGAIPLLELAEWVREEVWNETGKKQKPGFWGELEEPPILWRRAR